MGRFGRGVERGGFEGRTGVAQEISGRDAGWESRAMVGRGELDAGRWIDWPAAGESMNGPGEVEG